MTTAVIDAAVSQLLVFSVSRESLAAPIEQAREVIKLPSITPVPGSPSFVEGVFSLRGKIMPVLGLAQLLKLPAAATQAGRAGAHIIVVDSPSNGLIGLRVDQVTEIIKITSQQIKPAPDLVLARLASDYIDGVIMPEKASDSAKIILIVDLLAIITDSVAETAKQTVALQSAENLTPSKEPV